MENEQNPTKKSESQQEDSRAPVTPQQHLEQSGAPQQTTETTGPQFTLDVPLTSPEKESPDISKRTLDSPRTPEEITGSSDGPHGTAGSGGPQDTSNVLLAPPETKESPDISHRTVDTPRTPEETTGASDGLHETTGSTGPQDTPNAPLTPPETKESPDMSQRTVDTPRTPEETTGASDGPHDTGEAGGPRDTPNALLPPPETKESPDGTQGTDAPHASEETSDAQPDELQETNHSVEETGVDNVPKGITDDPTVPSEFLDTNDSPQAPEDENEAASNPQSTLVDVPPKSSESDVFPDEQPETKDSPLESEDVSNNLPQDTIDTSPTTLESANLQDEKGIPNEAPTELQEGTPMSIMPDSLQSFPSMIPYQVPEKSHNERTKKLSIDKIHRFSFKLSTLRAKQYEIIKKLKIMEAARPKFVFADLEIKTALSERKPEKEKLLYLFSENRRMEEKCFYGDIEIKKCEQMTSFYSGKRQEFLNMLYTLSSMTHNAEAEDYLRSIKNDLLEALKATHAESEKHKQAMTVRNKDFQQLTMEMMKAAEANDVSQKLRTKLKKGTPLGDDEILQLTLEKCLETNYKLKTSIQSLGVQIDNLREQYLWKRNEFVTKLSSEFDTSFLITAPPVGGPSITSPERVRSPSCNKGKSARDFDEELTSLRKENFDLKMRVYVLNEQMELFQNVDNADQLYEVNSNLKKDVEKLRAELSEKDELVLKAGEAMNLLSAKHRDDVASFKLELQELQDMNLRLEQEVERLMSQHNMTSSLMGAAMEDSCTQYALAFAPLSYNKPGADIVKLEEDLSEKLKVIEDNERIIKEYDDMVKSGKIREKELEAKLKSMSESLSELTKEIREKENHRLQIVKKACELEELVSLKQLEVDKLQKMLIAKPTPEDLKEIRNKYECCTTENNVLINRITELENMLDEVESKKFEYETVQEKARQCSTCRQYKNIAELLERSEAQLSQTERELEQAKKEQFNTVKALQGCLKANKALTTDIETLNKQIKSCGCTDPKIPQKEDSALKIRDLVERVSKLQQEKHLLTAAMEENTEALQRRLREKENIILDLQQESEDRNNNKIEELEAQVSRLKSEMEGISSSEAANDMEKKQLLAEVESKKKEIESLNEELRKRTCNLQELVNTELWDKNREIEKLNKTCEKKQQEVMSLKERLTAQEYELRALNDKMQELSDQVDTSESISELKGKLTVEIEKRVYLESEAERWKVIADESEKVRKELTNACGLFKARLEELASFLESLLPCLGGRKRKILQDAIDRSREASRTLSQSVMNENSLNENTLTAPILPDFSQVDFFSDNDIDVTVESNKSCLVMQNEEVANLRAKMESVVQKLDDVRSIDKSKNSWKINNYEDRFDFVKLANMSSSFNIEEVSEVSLQESFSDTASAPSRQPSQPKPAVEALPAPVEKVYNRASALSESEGWSEPDRNVSLARIGLRDSSVPSGRLSTEESSDNSCKLAICKRRCEATEIRRLSLKVRSLERVIQSLRTDRTNTTRSPSRDTSPPAGGDAPEKTSSAVDDLKKEKTKLEASLKNNKDILNQLTASYEDEPSNKQLLKAVQMIAQQFEQIYGFFTEMEDHYLVLEEEKEAVHLALDEKEKKVDSLNKEVASLQAELKEKENEILEKQCALLEMKNGYILMENKCKLMESTIDELSKWKAAMLKSEEELEAMKDSHLKEINNLKNKLKKVKDEREAEVNELKTSLDRAFKRIDDVCLKKVLMETEFKQKVDSLQKEKRLEVEQEVIKRIEVERKLVESYESQGELRKRLDEEMTKSKDVETAQKSSERWWRRRTEEVESTCADREAELRRRLDNATIATSQAVLERTRLANEKIRLQCELRRRENSAHDMRAELEQRVIELEESNKELLRKLKALRGSQHLSEIESPPPFARQRSNPTSDYTSDPDQHELKGSNGNLNHWFPVCGRSNNNCSPDLGIESDQGRLSSLDPPIGSSKAYGDMEREIAFLKRELARKSRRLEEVHRASKSVKEKLEDQIYSELDKTHDLLEKTKRNFKKAQI